MGFFDSNTQTKPKMFGPSKDLMSMVLKDAKQYYKKGKPSVFTKPTFTGMGTDSNAALTGLSALAGGNSGGAGLSGNAQKIIDNGGFTDGQLETLGGMRDLTNSSYFDEMINGDGLTADQRLVQDRNRKIMSDPIDINANPAYAAVRERALKEAQMGIDAQAAKAGRYGGASSQTIAARERGNLAADMDLGEYRSAQQRADNAATGLAALAQTGTGNRSGAITQKSGLQGALFNAENAGLDNMTRAFEAATQPYLTQRAVGQERDAETQKIRDDEIRQFDAKNPMNIYQQFMALANGAPTGSVTQTNPSWAQLLTGGGLGLAALANAF